MVYLFLALFFLFTILTITTKFRPLFALSGGFLFLSFSLYFNLTLLLKIVGFFVFAIVFEILSKPFLRLFKKEKDNQELKKFIGEIGKVRDIVSKKRNILLVHCCGRDFTAIGDVKLGDHVKIVNVKGHNIVVEKSEG